MSTDQFLMISVGRIDPELRVAYQRHEVRNLRNGTIEIVVHKDEVGHFRTDLFFGVGLRQTFGDVSVVVAAVAHTSFLFGPAGRQHQDDDCARISLAYCFSALHVDLEHEIAARRAFGGRRAVAVLEELGPLEKAAHVDSVLEDRWGDKDVRVVGFIRPLGSRCPAPAEMKRLVVYDKTTDNRAFASTTRAAHDKDSRLQRFWNGGSGVGHFQLRRR